MLLKGKIAPCIAIAFIAFTFASIGVVSSNAVPKQSAKARTPLNVAKPIGNIVKRFNAMVQSLNVSVLADTFLTEFPKCFGGSDGNTAALIDSAKMLAVPVLEELLEKYNTMEIPAEIITKICNSEDFEIIHKGLWGETLDEFTQFKDFTNFLWRFGYPQIYTDIINKYKFYNCPIALRSTIPTNGTIPSTRSSTKTKNSIAYPVADYDFPTKVFHQVPNPLLALFANSNCSISAITKAPIDGVIQTGLQILLLIDTLTDEVARSAPLHFLVGFFQEPIKGQGFREFRELKPIRCLLDQANKAFIENGLVALLLEVIRGLTSLDLTQGNLLETIIAVFEMIVWKNFRPIDAFTGQCNFSF